MPTEHEQSMRQNMQWVSTADDTFWEIYAATPKTDQRHYAEWCAMVQEFIRQHTGETVNVRDHTVGTLTSLVRDGKIPLDEVIGLAAMWKVAFT